MGKIELSKFSIEILENFGKFQNDFGNQDQWELISQILNNTETIFRRKKSEL